jgi:DNA polymerase-3 subunit gamma/tau
MVYQVIARKWRPQTFEEVTGQEAVTRTLRNAVQYERLHHAYLFSGARGVGKTTTARLLAKALNCHKTDKPNPKPCSPTDKDPCASCLEIAEGRSIDVLEIDAASHTGIDDVRDTIIESINVNPARDRYKVFIIDEVHQLSKPAFNALLKTLEEPPPNVVFIMATTELHKVPDTILSRCQEFEFRTIALSKIFDSLKNIAGVEKVNISDAALREIARAGEGSMRDAQSAFDQVISFSGEKIEVEDVVNALGIAGVDILIRAVKGIAEHNTLEAFEIVEELVRRGHDLRSFCRDLLSFFRDLLVAKVAGKSEGLLDWAAVSQADLQQQAAQFSEADLLRFFNSLADTESQLRTATQPRYILEIGLVKLMEMRRVLLVEKILERLALLEQAAGTSGPETKTETAAAEPEIPEISASSASAGASAEKKTEFVAELPEEMPQPPKGGTQNAPPEIAKRPTPPEGGTQSAPVYSQPQTAAAPAMAFAPQLTSEDLAHVEDNWLDSAYERALMREGDDLSLVLTLDLPAPVPEPPKFAPPPPPVTAAPAEKAQPNGKPAAPSSPAQRSAVPASSKKLAQQFRTVLQQKGKSWLAKAFDEISRINVGEKDVVFLLAESAEYWKAILQSEENIQLIGEIAREILGQELSPVIKTEGQDVRLNVPSTAEIAKNRDINAPLWQAAQDDPGVKQILNVFRGQIIDVRKTTSD